MTKANIQPILLNDNSFVVLDSICSKYYNNNDSIKVSTKELDSLRNHMNVGNISIMEVVSFLVNSNREKLLIAQKNNTNVHVLSQKLYIAFEPELLKIFKSNKLKSYAILKENISNLFLILIAKNNSIENISNEQIQLLNAGDVERMIYTTDNAESIQQQINFVLNNSNYKIIK